MISKDFERELFESEIKTLESARAEVADAKYKDNELLSSYNKLIKEYDKLLKLTRKIFKISDSQGKSLKQREYEVKNLLNNANQGFLTFGSDLIINKEYSAECLKIFEKKISSLNVADILADNEQQRHNIEQILRSVFDCYDPDQKLSHLRQLPRVLKLDDKYINLECKIIEQDTSETDQTVLMLISTDVTEKQRAEQTIKYLSYHDKLTGLYNRAYVEQHLDQIECTSNRPISVILADMNGLKITNDVFGHDKGDRLLIQAAQLLIKCCRKNDIIARWGGDEFFIILPNTDADSCEKVCARIKEACKQVPPDPIEMSIALGSASTDSISAGIFELFSIAETRMYSNKIIESKTIRKNIIMKMEQALEDRCFENHGHTKRLKLKAAMFAELLGFGEGSPESKNLELLTMLHDIGKVAIPKEVLGKPGPLTSAEWDIIEAHSEIGYRMAQSIGEQVVAEAILAMHERWDGTGYPYGLKETEIPLITRITAIVDVFDILTHDRPYKKALTKSEALKEIIESDGQFDPHLVKIFVENIDKW
ncbi:bifunctional diguanylate cyclase/phosphohydrolase [Dendrosporobacter sp. 1207_IL3150]|uniref:bifunctional diguanylate cyclase/phosphohydrolase n=1 Tax=Dendrosporobacter sp. 1207_IL3150 TaxID=3084054 RepID=UPI002FDAC9A6